MMDAKYDLSFSWESTYGTAVRMLERLSGPPGLVIELGCGHAPAAEPLRERGFTYVGTDVDERALGLVQGRGFETHRVDMADAAALPGRLRDIAAGRPVSAFVLLDSLEHVPSHVDVLGALREAALALGGPHLVLSVPNVTHFDVAAKLMLGRWDTTATGLLDETHVRFYSLRGLRAELERNGWIEADRQDVVRPTSDQAFPPGLPTLTPGTPLTAFLRAVRDQADPDAAVNQFVRLFAFSSRPLRPAAAPERVPFLSVVMRTQGTRNENLLEALTCLAAQTVDDFEVLLFVHSSVQERVDGVRQLVDTFSPTFSHRVRVLPVAEGGRSRPLNAGLEAARGHYVAFLDDDDLVFAHWVETFRDGAHKAPGRLVRSVVVDRAMGRSTEPGVVAPHHALGPLQRSYRATFDLVEHVYTNNTPICGFAAPMSLVRELRLRFEDLPVLEDWCFLQQVAMYAGVHDTREPTSIYHRWQTSEASLSSVPTEVWETTRKHIIQMLDQRPLLLPPGSASRLAALQEALRQGGYVMDDERIQVRAPERPPRYEIIDRANALLKRRAPGAHRMLKAVIRRVLR